KAKPKSPLAHGPGRLVGPRIHDGNNGALVVTPFQLASGQVILVNRGWVPDSLKDRAARAGTLVDGLRPSLPSLLRLVAPSSLGNRKCVRGGGSRTQD